MITPSVRRCPLRSLTPRTPTADDAYLSFVSDINLKLTYANFELRRAKFMVRCWFWFWFWFCFTAALWLAAAAAGGKPRSDALTRRPSTNPSPPTARTGQQQGVHRFCEP